jgi:hypothetical protein
MDGPNHPRSVATFGPTLMRVVTALCAAFALFVAAAAAASAQATPAPGASPAGQTMPGPGSSPAGPNPQGGTQPAAPPAPPLGHMPIIDFVGTFTQPAYYGSAANIKNYDPMDLGGTVRLPVTRKFSLFFDRITEGTVNQPLGCERVLAAHGETVCPSDTRDVILQYHGTYTFDRHWSLDVGDAFRHREQAVGACTATNPSCGASGASSVPFNCNNNGHSTGPACTISSTEAHDGYAGISYATAPIAELLHSVFVFGITGSAQNVDHHVAALCSAANKAAYANNGFPASCAGLAANNVGYFDENPHQSVYYESTQSVSMIVPVDPRHGTSFLANERWGALNWYETPSQLNGGIGIPYRWNSALALQLSKRFSPGFTLAVRHQDYHSLPGMALAYPNAIHVGSWDVIGTFHLDTNTWFH